MKRISKLRIKVQFRLILTCLILSCLIIGIIAYVTLQSLLVKNAATYVQNTTQKFSSEIEYLLARVSTIYDYLQYNKDIEQMFVSPYTEKSPECIRDIQIQFTSYSIMNRDISDIALVSDTIHWSSFFHAKALDSIADNLGDSYKMHCLGIMESPLTHVNDGQKPQLVFARNYYGVHDNKYYGRLLGSIILSIDPSKSPISLPQSGKNPAYFILADKKSNAYPFNCTPEFCKQIMKQCGDISRFTSTSAKQLETSDYLIQVSYIPSAEYYIISTLNKHDLNHDLVATTSIIVIIMMVTILFILFIMLVIQQNIINPINQLYLFIRGIRKGDRDKLNSSIELFGCEEIHTLSLEFSNMLNETDLLNNQLIDTTVNLYETRLQKKQAELAYLRSQINPHFLYNTLESVKDIALEHGVPQIADIASAMGKMFRYNVKGNETVLFYQELEITQAYLKIQLARFPDKFDIIYSVLEETLHLPVMKLLLQPLIENAVFHGLESQTGKGTLFIGALIENDDFIITIQDDGVGIDSQTLELLQQQISDSDRPPQTDEHIGMLNTHYRIRLRYGAPYGLSIESSSEYGTKVILRLPKGSRNSPPF